MDPVVALEEIALLLERDRASRYRSRAFRSAADTIRDSVQILPRDERALQAMPGIGRTSARVIAEALAGSVPTYLAQLRESVRMPAGGQLRRALRGDLHMHSEWSDGLTPIAAMIEAARAEGHEYAALTDHSPRLRVANGLSARRLRAQLAEIAAIQVPGFALLSGIEVDILTDGTLDQDPELLASLEIVVASAHSHLRMEPAAMTRRLVAAVRSGLVDVLGHVTGQLVSGSRGTRAPSQFDADAVFAACAEQGVAIEINSRPERCDPPDDLLVRAREAGCLFSIDSDAHAPGQLALVALGAARAEGAGIDPARVVTTWPLERLRDWRARARQ